MKSFADSKSIVKKICALGLTCLGFASVASAQQKIYIPEEFADFKEVSYKFHSEGPTLIFSDSPEFVQANGILYRDLVMGKNRIFFHHLNDVKGTTKKLAVVLKNKNHLRPIRYIISRQGMAGKTNNWLLDGKLAEENYFTKKEKPVEGKIGFGRTLEIISGKGMLLNYYKLWTGIVDFEVDQEAELSVIMCDSPADISIFNENAKILPMDEHPLRGTFSQADWIYDIKDEIKSDGNYMLKLASEAQGYIKGVDKTTGLPAENYGNYGVMYKMNFTIGGEHAMRFVLNPQGGPFNGWGVLEHEGKQQFIGMPAKDIATENNINDGRVLAKLKPCKYQFTWSPAGTSSLPLRFFWMPDVKLGPRKYFKSYKASQEE